MDGVSTLTTAPTSPTAEPRRKRNRKRRSRPRGKTYNARAMRAELRAREIVRDTLDLERPRTRAECRAQGLGGPGYPCPWVGCERHLYLDVTSTGSLHITFPELEPWELTWTCSSARAERGGVTLEEVGEIMNLTRERVRQIEVKALFNARANGAPNPHDTDDDGVVQVLDDAVAVPRRSSTGDGYDD